MKKFNLILSILLLSLCLFAQDYTQLYVVGAGTPAGWDANKAVPMTLIKGSDAVFTWTGPLTAGEFKFINNRNSWKNSFTAAGDGYTELNKSYPLVFNDATDKKFLTSADGLYKLTVDMKNLKMDYATAAPSTGLLFNKTTNSFINLDYAITEIKQFTIEAWVFYNSIPSGEGAYILSTEDSPEAGSQGFSLRANGNKLQLCIGNGNWVSVTGKTSLNLGTWYHIAATCSESALKIYINGKLDGSVPLNKPMVASAKKMRIGESPTYTNRLFDGVMADLRLWNVVRTADEIMEKNTTSLTGSEIGLVANWKMNEGTGDIVTDIKTTFTTTKPSDVKWFIGTPKLKPVTNSLLICSNKEIEEAYNLAVKIVGGNVRGGILAAGAEYNTGWTRDCSINNWFAVSFLNPEVAEASIWNVTNDRKTIAAEYWDRIIWVIAALEHYKVTGDIEFLRQAYTCSANSMKIQENDYFDTQYGLFKGPSVFNDGISGYPEPIYDPTINSGAVVSHPNSASIKCLSTNCVYFGAYNALKEMGTLLKIDNETLQSYQTKADAIQANILKYLYSESENKLNYLIDNTGAIAKYQEGLGISFATILGVLNPSQAKKVIGGVTISEFGITSIYPDFSNFSPAKPGRHNNIIWPHVNGFFAQAAINVGDTSAFKSELNGITRLALDRDKGNYDFCEVYNPYTGAPDGGWQNNGHWPKLTRQTWCATGYMNMVYHGLLGMRFSTDGITFQPYLPANINQLELKDITYRNAVLDILVKGAGTKIKSFLLNGLEQNSYSIDTTLQGPNKIEIELENTPSDIPMNPIKTGFKVWPTQVNKGEIVSMETSKEGVFKIISMDGIVVLEQVVKNKTNLPVNLSSGNYILQFSNLKSKEYSKLIIK